MNRGIAIRLCDETFSSATETDSPHSPAGSRRSALSTIAIHRGLARRHRPADRSLFAASDWPTRV
jgi:hypothetical protein